MDLWLIIDGETRGPIPDYEVRGMIERGEIGPDTQFWQPGTAEWQAISSTPLFEREFDGKPPHPAPELVVPPPLPKAREASNFWMRRFWARWFDLFLYAAAWWQLLAFFGADIKGVLENLMLTIFLYLPWVPLESLLLARFGTTPGKWILGLRVINEDGKKLSGEASVLRSLRVYFQGIGLGLTVLSPLCQVLAWLQVRSTGKTIWDQRGGHRVVGRPIRWWNISAYAVTLYLVILLQVAVVAPFQFEILKERSTDLPAPMRKWIDRLEGPAGTGEK